MKKIITLSTLALLLFISNKQTIAQNGDTVTVQTFTLGSPQDTWFVFPSDKVRFKKIYMKYTLKCNPAQNPACGEWDYLTNTYVYKHTGLLDSSVVNQPIYRVNGATPDSIRYMNTPSYSYSPSWQYFRVNTNTISLTTDTIGRGNLQTTSPFGTSNPVSRCQYLWKASEMTAAGIVAGNITGLQFFLQSLGGSMRNMTINIKATALDSLTQATFNNAGFTNVYSKNTQFNSTGWNSLQLTNPFNWDGISNLLIEITYDNTQTNTDNVLLSDTCNYNSGLVNAGSDRIAAFHTYGSIDLPLNNKIAALDSFVTVSFWAHGTPAYQPMDGTCFEAVDSLGNRVLNTHLPWSDSNVYWDAGNNAGYDRINKVAAANEIEGQWNYWAFTKNVGTGTMNIYLNGNLWHTGTAKVKRMQNIKKFRIGKGNWGGSQTYEGSVDDFAVFNTELSQATIQAYMNKAIDAQHPNYNNLALYYHFDDGNYQTAADVAPGNHAAGILSSVNNPLKAANEISTNFVQTKLRPNVVFEQGVYNSYIDSVLVIDSTMNAPIQIITYTDSLNNPAVPTDTLNVWPAYYNNYAYNAQGIAYDSTFVNPDSTMYMVYYKYYVKFPKIDRYELARYITPYGNGLSLGNGWTWTFDVSDYRTLLKDSVHLSAGNWQELLDVKFLMIKGIPPRDVLDIQNLCTGNFDYGNGNDPIDNHLVAKNAFIPNAAVTSRLKSRITGHGMDSPQNCAEFCPKNHYFFVDGIQQFTKLVWRDNCDVNPLYPQGGTWVYDRANWCPGAEVWTYDMELTPYVTPGTVASIDHNVEAYVHISGWDYYQIEDQVVTYSAPNFTLDAAIEDILSPSTDQMHLRLNPVCTNPIIRIKNTGSTTLTSLTITYGLNGGAVPTVYNWTGSLAFMEIATVTLGNFNWSQSATEFTVTLSNPNGGADQYAFNNTKKSTFTYPSVMPSQMIIEMKSNSYPGENSYTLKNSAGTVLLSRSNLSSNTVYKDTMYLPFDCYEFELTDTGEDGLSFWANANQGSGYLKFKRMNNSVVKNFGPDFGGKIYQQFTVGLTNDVNENVYTNKTILSVYPNPSNGHIFIDVDFSSKKAGIIEITDVLGKIVYTHSFAALTATTVEADLSSFKNGLYFVTLKTDIEVLNKKLLLAK